MKVLFLDLDGVLRPLPFRQPRPSGPPKLELCPLCSGHLQTVLKEIPNLKIVISSSWRKDMPEVEKAFKKVKLPFDRVIGATAPSASGSLGERGILVADWLRLHPQVEQYAILDDDSDFTQDQQSHLVKTKADEGLTTFDAARLMLKFEG